MSTALTLAATTAIATARRYASHVEEVVDVIDLDDADQAQRAGQCLRLLETAARDAEAARKAEKAPHLAAGRDVDAAFRAALDPLAHVTGRLRARIAERAERRRREQEEAVRLAAEAARAGDGQAANAAIALAPQTETIEGVAERWTYEIASIDMRTVPREWLALDVARVRAHVADCVRRGETPAIEGLSFERKATLTVKSVR